MKNADITLISLNDGAAGVLVNGKLVMVDDPNYCEPASAKELAEKLAEALGANMREASVSIEDMEAAHGEEWNWSDVEKAASEETAGARGKSGFMGIAKRSDTD